MFFISDCLVKGMRLSYRISGYNFRYFATQLYYPRSNINAQSQYSNKFGIIHYVQPGINCIHEKCKATVIGSHHLWNETNNHHHASLERSFKSRSRNNDGHKKKILKLSALLSLSLFSAKEEPKEEKESELIIMIKRGILALKNGELNKAEQLLHVALKTAQEGQNELAVTYIFDLLANLAYQREEYTKAENLFKEVLKRMFRDGMRDDDNAVVEISLKLASVYASKKDYEKAVEGFHFCIATQEAKIKKLGEKNLDEDSLLLWAMSMDWYARFLLSVQQYEMAKIHFIKAYEMSERVQGTGHTQTAVLLNDIGSVCSLQKNYEEAIKYLEKAIDAARISQSSDIASFYVNLGAVYLQQEIMSSAERYCKEGLSLAKKMKNDEAVDEANACLAEINALKNKK